MKISNDEYDAMKGSLSIANLLEPEQPTVALMKRFLALPASRDARMLISALAACGLLRARIGALMSRLAELEKTDVAPLPLITGDDLTGAGLCPGPLFKNVLDSVYDAQLEGRISTRDQAMSLALNIAGK
jgi:hypothetical protein